LPVLLSLGQQVTLRSPLCSTAPWPAAGASPFYSTASRSAGGAVAHSTSCSWDLPAGPTLWALPAPSNTLRWPPSSGWPRCGPAHAQRPFSLCHSSSSTG
uniref:Uncharacterized protein n=1 Tax=Chelonoidis abingdonii TaxID=106734 RepID=A0A8C0GDR2_CHEAB